MGLNHCSYVALLAKRTPCKSVDTRWFQKAAPSLMTVVVGVKLPHGRAIRVSHAPPPQSKHNFRYSELAQFCRPGTSCLRPWWLISVYRLFHSTFTFCVASQLRQFTEHPATLRHGVSEVSNHCTLARRETRVKTRETRYQRDVSILLAYHLRCCQFLLLALLRVFEYQIECLITLVEA
jgi:hypothetical protein